MRGNYSAALLGHQENNDGNGFSREKKSHAVRRRRECYCIRYCTTTLASAGLVVQPLAAVCTATVSDEPAA